MAAASTLGASAATYRGMSAALILSRFPSRCQASCKATRIQEPLAERVRLAYNLATLRDARAACEM